MKTMTREEIAQLAIRKYEGTTCLVSSAQDVERAIHVIQARPFSLTGVRTGHGSARDR